MQTAARATTHAPACVSCDQARGRCACDAAASGAPSYRPSSYLFDLEAVAATHTVSLGAIACCSAGGAHRRASGHVTVQRCDGPLPQEAKELGGHELPLRSLGRQLLVLAQDALGEPFGHMRLAAAIQPQPRWR